MLGQIQVTYFDIKEGLTNKVGKIDTFSGDNAEITDEIIYENIYSTTSQLRSEI